MIANQKFAHFFLCLLNSISIISVDTYDLIYLFFIHSMWIIDRFLTLQDSKTWSNKEERFYQLKSQRKHQGLTQSWEGLK